MTEQRIISLGKTSQFISQFFRLIVIAILFSIFGIGTAGIGIVISLIIGFSIFKLIPFKTSIYTDFLKLSQQEIDKNVFRNQFRKKLIYNIIIFILTVIPAYFTFSDEFIYSSNIIIIPILVFGVMISSLIFQFYYFNIVNGFIKHYEVTFIQKPISTIDNIVAEYENPENLENEPIKIQSFDTENIEKQERVDYTELVKNKLTDLNKVLENSNIITRISKKIKTLNPSEIIILSVAIGAFAFIILGYGFADIEKFGYVDGEKYYVSRDAEYSDLETTTKLNYGLAFPGFIITAGISYLFLNSKKKGQNNNNGNYGN